MEQVSPPKLKIQIHSGLKQQWEHFPKEMKLQWITMMNSLGNSSSCEGPFKKCFSFLSLKYCPSRKHWWMSYARPISVARWICLFPGNATWGLVSHPWTRTPLQHLGADKDAEQQLLADTALEELSQQLPVQCAPRAIRCNKNLLVYEKTRGAWGCKTKQRAVNLFLSEPIITKSGLCFSWA